MPTKKSRKQSYPKLPPKLLWNTCNQERKTTSTMQTFKHSTKKLNRTPENGKKSHVHEQGEWVLGKWLCYQGQLKDSMEWSSKFCHLHRNRKKYLKIHLKVWMSPDSSKQCWTQTRSHNNARGIHHNWFQVTIQAYSNNNHFKAWIWKHREQVWGRIYREEKEGKWGDYIIISKSKNKLKITHPVIK